jgi:hypothetical protein
MKKILCKYLGGSHLYGLNTSNSDVDIRGVYQQTNPLYVYGFLGGGDTEVKQDGDDDIVMQELVHFIRLLTRSNTQSLECVYAPHDAFTELDERFKSLIIGERERFVDTDVLFKSLKGYIHNEMRLACGERTGQLGSKRKNSIDEHGFSPKNFSHLIRLAGCGEFFFMTHVYPVRLSDFDKRLHDLCFQIKTSPESFTKEELIVLANEYRNRMIATYESLKDHQKFKPNLDYISRVLCAFYER